MMIMLKKVCGKSNYSVHHIEFSSQEDFRLCTATVGPTLKENGRAP